MTLALMTSLLPCLHRAGMLRNDPQPAKYKGRLVSLLNMGASNALRVMNSEDT
jgi:hypothetical protein